MIDDALHFLSGLFIFAITFLVFASGANLLLRYKCQNEADLYNTAFKYYPTLGCYLLVDGNWIDSDNYVVVRGK